MSFVKGAELLDDNVDNEIVESMASIDMAHIVSSKLIYDHVTSSFPLVVGKAAIMSTKEPNCKNS